MQPYHAAPPDLWVAPNSAKQAHVFGQFAEVMAPFAPAAIAAS